MESFANFNHNISITVTEIFFKNNSLESKEHGFSVSEKLLSIKKIRVLMWYEFVRQALSLENSYQIEILFREKQLKDNKINVQTPLANNWYRYEQGLHLPQKKLLNEVEKFVSGSTKLIQHPLWEIMNNVITTQELSIDLINRLSPEIQMTLYQRGSSIQQYKSQIAQSLINKTSLDSLCALTYYWLDSKKSTNAKKNHEQAEYIYSALVILGVEYYCKKQLNIIKLLFMFFNDHIFHKTLWVDHLLFDITYHDYLNVVSLLHDRIDQINVTPQYLKSKPSYDIKFSLKPKLTIDAKTECLSKKQIELHCIHLIQHTWGMHHLERGTLGRFPSDELWPIIEKRFDTYKKTLLDRYSKSASKNQKS